MTANPIKLAMIEKIKAITVIIDPTHRFCDGLIVLGIPSCDAFHFFIANV